MRYATNGRGVCLWAGRRSSLRAAGMGNLEFDDLLLDVSRVGHDGRAGDLSHVVGEIGDGVAQVSSNLHSKKLAHTSASTSTSHTSTSSFMGTRTA